MQIVMHAITRLAYANLTSLRHKLLSQNMVMAFAYPYLIVMQIRAVRTPIEISLTRLILITLAMVKRDIDSCAVSLNITDCT